MTVDVALAVLKGEGGWLLQLRDDIEGIAAPGTWGLFGGHLDPGESAEEALRRELLEEINWSAEAMAFWFMHSNARRRAHFFRGRLSVPLSRLELNEGQDMALAELDALRRGWIWSERLQERRPLAPSLQVVVAELLGSHDPPTRAEAMW